MNGLMDRYRKSLDSTPGPLRLSDCPQVKMDLKGLIRYAQECGVQPVDLTTEEKDCFVVSWG